jgi:hypothetical protein
MAHIARDTFASMVNASSPKLRNKHNKQIAVSL